MMPGRKIQGFWGMPPEGSGGHKTGHGGTHLSFPGHISLFADETLRRDSGTPSGSPKNHPERGIKINQASEISAGSLLGKISNCHPYVESYFAKHLAVKDPYIYLTDPAFKTPKNHIPKSWIKYWQAAFLKGDWEMTTGSLEITVKKGTVKKGDSYDPLPSYECKPDLPDGESIDDYWVDHSLKSKKGEDMRAAGIEFGVNVERDKHLGLEGGVHLKSDRNLFMVVNRGNLHLGTRVEPIHVKNKDFVMIWFHEIACHSGRISAGLAGDKISHGDQDVDAAAQDILEDMFKYRPKLKGDSSESDEGPTTNIWNAIDNFVLSSK
jgi:hypothetical protein